MKWPLRATKCYKYPSSHGSEVYSSLKSYSPFQPANEIIRNVVRFKSSSTPAWLNRVRNDYFIKARVEANYRSRSAFKLVQINEQYKLFPPTTPRNPAAERKPPVVVDLGCAPGGWTQASLELLGFSRNTHMEGKEDSDNDEGIPLVVGVDLIQTEPLLGARFLRGNFLDGAVQSELRRVLQGEDLFAADTSREGGGGRDGVADLIISDMAPNLTGNRVVDIEASLELCRSVLAFAKVNLRKAEEKGRGKGFSGSLVIKHFAAPEFNQFREKELAPLFSQKIKYTKPEASRSSSSEAYFVCQGFKGIRS